MHHLQGSGLDNIFLKDGFIIRETRYGNGVSIKDIEGLYSAISLSLCIGDFSLTPEALRFLRKRLEFSQEQLGIELGCSDQAVAKWEKAETAIPTAASRMIRALTMKALFPKRSISDSITEISHKKMGNLSFAYSELGWTNADYKDTTMYTTSAWEPEFIVNAQLGIAGIYSNVTYIHCNEDFNQDSKDQNESQSIAA
jgi:putative transcriptional regulator